MTPTTFTATGTYTQPDGQPAVGVVSFAANNDRETSADGSIQDAMPETAHLDGAGSFTKALVVNAGGYTVTETLHNADPITYTIAGTADIDLGDVDATTSTYITRAGPSVRTIADPTYTVTDADVNNIIDCTAACTVTIPADLTVQGTISVAKAGSGDVTFQAAGGVTIDSADGLLTLATQYAMMTAVAWGSTTYYRLLGADA
jgi:hypothetical protein